MYPHSYRTEHTETHTSNSEYGDYYAKKISKKIKIQPALLKILQYVDSNHKSILQNLNEIVGIKSTWPTQNLLEIVAIKNYIEGWMKKLGGKYESFNIGMQQLGDKRIKMPPVTLATIKGSSNITVCVYCHADVRDPCMSRWKTDPWKAVVVGKEVYGNGVVHGKGPLMCWLHMIKAFQEQKIPLPVTVKFIVEMMHYNRSAGLKDFLITQKQNFLYDIDHIMVHESEWFDDKYPCITYGVVGYIHYDLFITKVSDEDPEENMKQIFSHICREDVVTIPKFNKYVTQITPDEENLYESIHVNWEEYKKHLPPDKQDWSKTRLLMHFWRNPTITVGKTEHCTCEKKDTTKIVRHFVIKIVPKQIPELTCHFVRDYILDLVKALKIKNEVEIETSFDSKPWVENCSSLNYEAARRATIQIYKEDPSMIRDDKDLKCLNILEMIERNILLLPLGIHSGNGGDDNEHIPRKNFFEAIKLIAAYLMQLRLLSESQNKKLLKA